VTIREYFLCWIKQKPETSALKYAKIINQELASKNIILFGSYINGTPTENSDIDIAVVFGDFLR